MGLTWGGTLYKVVEFYGMVLEDDTRTVGFTARFLYYACRDILYEGRAKSSVTNRLT